MQLRQRTNIRVPDRYTESSIPISPGVATFVHPTIPYNPDLPPAAFPTLDFPPAINPGCAPAEEMGMPAPRKAIVFYDKRISPEVAPFIEQAGFGELTPSLAIRDASQRTSERTQGPGGCSCGSYEHLSVNEIKEKGLGQSLEDFEVATEWSDISDGLKLIIVSELSKEGRSFDQVIELLALSDEVVNDFVEIHNQEILRREREEGRIVRSQALQLRTLLNGACTSRSVFTDSLERSLYANLEEPAASIIRKRDIERASLLLTTLRINHLADRLWSLEGAALSDNILYGPVRAGQQELDEPPAPESVDEDEDTDTDDESWVKRKKRSTRRRAKRVLGEPQPKETSADVSNVVRLRLSSGLRKAISGENLEETIATKPAALQSSMKSQNRPTAPAIKKIKPNVKIVNRKSGARAAVPAPTTAEDETVAAALKIENESESGLGETLNPTRSGIQTATKPTSTVNARGASSRAFKLRYLEKALAAGIARRLENLPHSSIQITKENQEDDPSNEPLEESLPHGAVEAPFIASHAPRDMRTRKATNVLEKKTIKVPALISKEVVTKASKALAKGHQTSEVVTPTKKTGVDVQQKGATIVVRNVVRSKRKRQYDSDDDPDR